MKVIDLSAWQTDVDWQAIVDAGIEGVILKLGERDTLDEMFVEHVNNAVAHSLKYGVHYIDVDALPDYVPLWVAQYNSHDDLSGEYPGRVRIWQYSDHFSDELPYDADEYYEE